MIPIEQALEIHYLGLVEFGGATGVRDMEGLEAALYRPYSGFGDSETFPDPREKAAAMLHGVCQRHPFVDGNKRAALAFSLVVLHEGGFRLDIDHLSLYEFVVGVASGATPFEEVVEWFMRHSVAHPQ